MSIAGGKGRVDEEVQRGDRSGFIFVAVQTRQVQALRRLRGRDDDDPCTPPGSGATRSASHTRPCVICLVIPTTPSDMPKAAEVSDTVHAPKGPEPSLPYPALLAHPFPGLLPSDHQTGHRCLLPPEHDSAYTSYKPETRTAHTP